MDFLNNLINNIRNYFVPQQTQAPVNAVQPWQWPIAPIQQSVDYNAVAWQPIQQIQLPEIQLPQIQTWPVAPVQQTIDYSQAIAWQPITPLPTIDFSTAIAWHPITQAQPFQLWTPEQYFAPVIQQQEQPTLQQLIQQQQAPQWQAIWTPIDLSIPTQVWQWSTVWIQQQLSTDLQWNIWRQDTKDITSDMIVEEATKQRASDEAKALEQEVAINSLKEKYWDQKAFDIVYQQNKEAEENFTKDIIKKRDEQYAQWNIIWWVTTWLIWFWKFVSDTFDAIWWKTASQRAFEQTYAQFNWIKTPKLELPKATTIQEIKEQSYTKDSYEEALKPYINQRNTFAWDLWYKVSKWLISKEDAAKDLEDFDKLNNAVINRIQTYVQTRYKNWWDDWKAIAELWIWTKYRTLSQYLKQDIPWPMKDIDSVSPEDALKAWVAVKILWNPYADIWYAWNILTSIWTLWSLAWFWVVKWALYEKFNIIQQWTQAIWLWRPLDNYWWILDLYWASQAQQADLGEIRTTWKSWTQKRLTTVWDWAPEFITSIWAEILGRKGVGMLWKIQYITKPTTAMWRYSNVVAKTLNWLDVFVGSQLQNAVLEAASAPLWDDTITAYALNPFFDIVWEWILNRVVFKPLSLDINQIVDWDYTQAFLRATAIDSLNKKAGDNAVPWTEDVIKEEIKTLKNVTQEQVDEYRNIVEASARWAIALQKENPKAFDALFKQKVGERFLLDIMAKYDWTTASKIQLTWFLNDLADADIWTAEMVGRALWTWWIIHSMDWTSYNPLNLDAWSYWLYKQWVKDVPQDVIDAFWSNFNVTWKIDSAILDNFAVSKWIDTADMLDNSWRLTIEWVRKLWIKLDGDVLAKFAKWDQEILVRSVSEKTWVSNIEWARAISKIHNIIWDIVC